MSSDIENPLPVPAVLPAALPGAGDAATVAAPEPSRHGFWALKERLVALYFTGDNNPQHHNDDVDGEVATVDADQCSRSIFVNFWSWFFLLLFIGFMSLLVFPSAFNVGSAWIIAARVIGIIGTVVAFCCAGFFIDLSQRLDEGDISVHRAIDSLL